VESKSARHWWLRAEEARQLADEITHPPSKDEMLQIAAAYRRLAKHAEERALHDNEKMNKR
jgi:hypothetical protein